MTVANRITRELTQIVFGKVLHVFPPIALLSMQANPRLVAVVVARVFAQRFSEAKRSDVLQENPCGYDGKVGRFKIIQSGDRTEEPDRTKCVDRASRAVAMSPEGPASNF